MRAHTTKLRDDALAREEAQKILATSAPAAAAVSTPTSEPAAFVIPAAPGAVDVPAPLQVSVASPVTSCTST